jgi:hypothetical protein
MNHRILLRHPLPLAAVASRHKVPARRDRSPDDTAGRPARRRRSTNGTGRAIIPIITSQASRVTGRHRLHGAGFTDQDVRLSDQSCQSGRHKRHAVMAGRGVPHDVGVAMSGSVGDPAVARTGSREVRRTAESRAKRRQSAGCSKGSTWAGALKSCIYTLMFYLHRNAALRGMSR